MLPSLHTSYVGLVNSKPIGQLPLREMMLSPKVRDLNGQPSGQRRPLPLRTELGVAEVLRQNILVSYELIGHLVSPANNKLVIAEATRSSSAFPAPSRCLATRTARS